MARKTKYDYYDDHFKVTAVALGDLPGAQAKDVAAVLDIHPVMLYRWKKEVRDGVIMKKSVKGSLDNDQAKELKRLQKVEKAYERLQMEYDLLKKSIQYCSDQKKRSSNS
jgi:transposase